MSFVKMTDGVISIGEEVIEMGQRWIDTAVGFMC